MSAAVSIDFYSFIQDVPDFPKKGIVFKDVTPLLANPKALRAAIEAMAAPFKNRGVKLVAGVESRGFLFASSIAGALDAGVVLIRKKGKLPRKTLSVTYDLEYGVDTLELHADAAGKGDSVLLVDDVLATGGTAKAACELIEKLGADVVGAAFLIELGFLKGREKLAGRDVRAVLRY
jgi:adenine phosphoribosyltransferase